MLPPQERGALMKAHGELGKTYLDVLSEFTTGGCGLDDWEWGITIFSNDDIQFKKNCIRYALRRSQCKIRHLQRLLCWYHHR